MSVETAAAPSAAPLRIARLRPIAFVLAIAGLTLLAAVLRDRALGAPFWIDEGLSVGIASHPFADIPNVLRVDGSPPLYYLLLHLWIAVAGDSEHATHLLSVLFAVIAVPAAAWALLPVFGELAALSAAALVALSPFVGVYADEGRMYSLVFLLGTVAAGAFLRVFVLRRRSWSFGCAGVFATLLYTHAWGAFFVATAGVAGLVLLAVARDRRALFVDLVICFGGAALLFAPWLPIALEQSRHTAAPWSHAPSSRSLTRALTRMLTGIPPELVLLGAGGTGALLALWHGTAPQRRAVLTLTTIAAGTLLLGYLASRDITPAWSFRYLVIVLAPLLLALGAGIARLGVFGVAAIAVLGLVMWSGEPSVHQLENKSNVAAVSRALGPRLPRGSIVFSEQPEQVAALRYYLPAGLRYATPLGPVADPRVMDWRDAMARMRAASYARTLGRDVRGLQPGQRMLVVPARLSRPSSPWTKAIASIARRWTARVRADRRVRALAVIRPRRFNNRSTVSAVLLVRRTGAAKSRHMPALRRSSAAIVRVRPDARGRPIGASALGLSIEWDSVEAYTGPAKHRRTALPRLLAALARAAHSPLALRIGGDTGDQAWWNPHHLRPPRTVLQSITPRTLDAVAWLARELHGPVTLGLNLADGDAANALALARAAQSRLPGSTPLTLEIGNEPDLYTQARTFRVPGHVHRRLRKHARYSVARWARDSARYVAVLRRGLGARPRISVAGFAGAGWWPALDRALRAPLRTADVLSGHLYAEPSCSVRTPSIAWLVSPAASRGRVASLAPLAALARRHRKPLRVSELNSAACGGRAGLSDRFGSALWLADTLFALQRLGVQQADVHTWQHARYAPFAVRGGRVRARPALFGMLAFAQAAPAGSRLADDRRPRARTASVVDRRPGRHDPRRADRAGEGDGDRADRLGHRLRTSLAGRRRPRHDPALLSASPPAPAGALARGAHDPLKPASRAPSRSGPTSSGPSQRRAG